MSKFIKVQKVSWKEFKDGKWEKEYIDTFIDLTKVCFFEGYMDHFQEKEFSRVSFDNGHVIDVPLSPRELISKYEWGE